MFAVRVELKDVPSHKTWEVYEAFHKAMEKAGYARKIQSDDKKSYKLPDATYVATGTIDKSTALAQVKKLADATSFNAGIIVFDYSSSTWIGLEEIPTSSLFANA